MRRPLMFIVDDEQDICEIVSSLVEKSFNIDVKYALSYAAAIEQMEVIQPDYALLDIHLGDNESFDLVKELKKINPYIKILFISAFSGDSVLEKVNALNVEGILHKPFDTIRLKSKLNEIMGLNEGER